jgi:glycosyltransferase involved in cell wall biosynthesis
MEGAGDYMAAHGLEAEKFVCIPNGFDEETSQAGTEPLPDEHRRTLGQLRDQGKRIVLYSGHHGRANALASAIEAARLLEAGQPVQLLLVGQGPEKVRLQTQAQQDQLSNVTFLPPVNRAQMPALMGAVDLGYVGLQKRNLFKYGISPNKLFEYMAAGLPVIFAIDTPYDEVARAQCGFSVPAEDPVALAALLRDIGHVPVTQLQDMGARGREYARRNHTYAHLAERYARLF